MTLATGHRSDPGRRHGFTLIELVLVLALLVIAVSMVAPRISGFILESFVLNSGGTGPSGLTHA